MDASRATEEDPDFPTKRIGLPAIAAFPAAVAAKLLPVEVPQLSLSQTANAARRLSVVPEPSAR